MCVYASEEIGLNGAQALDKSQITARTMINMDSEEEGVATVSCAGGLRVQLTRKIERVQAEGTLVQIKAEAFSADIRERILIKSVRMRIF